MNFICVIPARYASTRLPGKPLADICGQPMIRRVYERAKQAVIPDKVIVATDHQGVLDAVQAFGGTAMLTSPDHANGTDRLAEVAAVYDDADVVINVQGDEPLISPQIIDQLAQCFIDDKTLLMATVKTPLTDAAEIQNPNNVKVVVDSTGHALYFSRSPLPYPRLQTGLPVYKHIGIYAYRRDFLLKYAKLAPTPLETAESLEQLRALENGYKIKVITTDCHFIGVDTPEDLEKVRAVYAAKLQ